MRFGLEDGSEHTLEEVGQSFQVTRERIRQIEAKALRKLRHPSRSRKLKAFVEGVANNIHRLLLRGRRFSLRHSSTRSPPVPPTSSPEVIEKLKHAPDVAGVEDLILRRWSPRAFCR